MKMEKIRDVLLIASVVVVGTFAFSLVAFVLTQDKFSSVLDIWNRWDAPHYIDIAKNWYQTEGDASNLIVFFPLYPLLIKLVALLFKNYVVSALVVSNIAYAVAAYYLYALVRLDYSRKNALRAVFYFSIFPTAYFLHAGYTESLFIALSTASFYYARKENWLASAVFGSFASATRISGILLLPSLVLEYLLQKRFQLKQIRREFLWLAIIPLGLLVHVGINYALFGNPFQFMQVLSVHWGKHFAFPWTGFLSAWGRMLWGSPSGRIMTGAAEVAFGIVSFAFAIYALVRQRISYGFYAVATSLLVTSTSYWQGIPRYSLAIFPMFLALSSFERRSEINYGIMFISLLLYGLFLTAFINGWWAF